MGGGIYSLVLTIGGWNWRQDSLKQLICEIILIGSMLVAARICVVAGRGWMRTSIAPPIRSSILGVFVPILMFVMLRFVADLIPWA